MIPQTTKGSFARTETIPQTSDSSTVDAEQKKVDETATCNQPGTDVSPSPSANASAEAADRRGFLNMGADYLRKSLDNVMDGIPQYPAKPKQDSLGECLPESPKDKPTVSPGQKLAQVDRTELADSEKFDHYKNLIELNGGTFNSEPGARNIVAVRYQTSVDAGPKNAKGEGQGVYDDEIAVLWKDENGKQQVREFHGNTEPNRRWANDVHGSEDVNKDGRNDAGRLLPKFYEYKLDQRTVNDVAETALRPVNNVEVERDMNYDGEFTESSIPTPAGDSILIHNGKGNSSTGSAGCQTVKQNEWDDFLNAVTKDGPEDTEITNKNNIGYTLVQLEECINE